jgi:AraC-like DNA-binding protein/mannose-6-phosphate isomerase-like protein (cupin superfamily)
MTLSSFCTAITENRTDGIYPPAADAEMGHRIMCPEYSIDHIDVKTFPLPEKEDLFLLCWNIEGGERLQATILPFKQPFTYSCTIPSQGRTQLHTHDYIELAYIVEGEFRQRIMGNDILFKKGELCLIDKNCPHQDFLGDGESIILFIGLANEIFDEVMVGNIGEEKILNFLRTALMKQKGVRQFLHFKPKNAGEGKLEELLLLLLEELKEKDAASRYICKGLIIRILHYISTMYDFSLSNEQRRKMNWLVYEELVRYIGENYARITVRELVAKFHFNEDYYNRLLKEKTGMTYLEYVQDIRLGNARRLLETTNLKVDEIAEQVGYQNKGYFYKIFVDKYGITPAKLRK